ncbi:SRPBCC family protein [bacterium]|nr:SRPBCC family protein [bacterium]
MTHTIPAQLDPRLDLVLERVVDVPPELVWKAWTTPEHLMKWFCPLPWTTVECEIDLRPGGIFRTVMRSPEGHDMPASNGCFLHIVENELLVFTDALQPDFRPAEKPFFTAVIKLERQGSGTKYTAIAMHRDEEAAKQHAEMGFHVGWGIALDQLVAHMKSVQAAV